MASKRPDFSAMRNYVQVQRNTPVQSPVNGEYVDNWQTYHNTWASFTLLSGANLQVQQAQTLAPIKTYKVETRYFTGLSQTDQLVWDGRVFTINSFDDSNGTRVVWQLVVTEVLR